MTPHVRISVGWSVCLSVINPSFTSYDYIGALVSFLEYHFKAKKCSALAGVPWKVKGKKCCNFPHTFRIDDILGNKKSTLNFFLFLN